MVFTREFKEIEKLKEDKLFINKLLEDCTSKVKDKVVFPAVRKGRIDFYFKGGCLFSYDTGFKTAQKYASVVLENGKTPIGDKISAKKLTEGNYRLIKSFEEGYKRIKENCASFSGVEALGVSSLYNKFSCITSEENFVILDIEASFTNLEDSKKSDRIDIVAYSKKDNEIYFIEAKHYSNSAISGQIEVCAQIERYKSQIKYKKEEILSAYANHIKVINKVFDISLEPPEKIYPNVILLVFGFNDNEKKILNGNLKDKLESEEMQIPYNFIGKINEANLQTIINKAKTKIKE